MSEIYTVIDVETTGLDPVFNQVIEIAALKTDGERELGSFHTFVRLYQGIELPEFITELTGITERVLKSGMFIEMALEALYLFIGSSTVIAHNAPFDISFTAVSPKRFICTRAMSFLAEPFESASLANVCERHGINLEGHHRAMNDVRATLEVFKLMREKLDAKGIEYHNAVVDFPDRPLSFIPVNAIVIDGNEYREKAKQNEEEIV